MKPDVQPCGEEDRIRKLKRRRKRMLVMSLSAAAVIVLAAGIYFGDEFENRVQDMQKTLAENLNERREKAEMEAASAKADAQKKKK